MPLVFLFLCTYLLSYCNKMKEQISNNSGAEFATRCRLRGHFLLLLAMALILSMPLQAHLIMTACRAKKKGLLI